MVKKHEKKINNSTITDKKEGNNCNVSKFVHFGDYLCTKAFKVRPISERAILELARELVKWVTENNNAIRIDTFVRGKGIPNGNYYLWLKRSDVLKTAHEYARGMIASRREGLAAERYPSTLLFMMPAYDDDWKKMTEWRATLKAKADAAAREDVTVNIHELRMKDEGNKP